MIGQRSAFALNVARQSLMHLSLGEFKALVRGQAFLLQLEPERALETIAFMVPQAGARSDLIKQVIAIVGAGDPPSANENERIGKLSQVLAVPIKKTASLAKFNRTSDARAGASPVKMP
jgi:hypothetical protein